MFYNIIPHGVTSINSAYTVWTVIAKDEEWIRKGKSDLSCEGCDCWVFATKYASLMPLSSVTACMFRSVVMDSSKSYYEPVIVGL